MAGELHVTAFGPPATALLGSLLDGIRAGDALAPVTVVVPSATAGTTLRRALAARSGGLVGVSFRSLPQVAASLAGPDQATGVAAMVSRAHIRRALRGGAALTPDPAVAASPATERALEVTFSELAPLDEPTLDVVAAAEPLAGAVVDLYRRFRDAAGLPAGGHDVARRATARVLAGDAPVDQLGTLVLHLPRRIRRSEVDLLRALAGSGVRVVGVVGRTGDADADLVADELVAALAPVLGEARWAGGPPAEMPWPTHLVRAPDPAEEVAFAVREVVAALSAPEPLRPERIALLFRVRDPYLALLHAALDDAGVPHHAGAVATLAQTVPGRVLTAVLDVLAGDFRRADVTALWRAGPILDPVTGHPIRASRWDRLAREAGIGGGLAQWRARLDRAITTRLDHLARYLPTSHTEPAEPTPEGGGDFRVEQWRAIVAHVEHLAGALHPPAAASWSAWSAWLQGLLASLVAPSARRHQPQAFERIDVVLRALGQLDGIEDPPSLELLRRVLEPELERPEPSHGRFGHGVVVGRLMDAVGADFDLVVVVGAADGQFPPHRAEDPLLSDRVRDLTGGALARRGLRREDEHRDLLAAFASAPRRILTAPRADPRAQRERQPAAWFVGACSHLARRMVASADLAGLRGEAWFTDVPSFEAHPAAGVSPATARELDLGDLLAEHAHLDVDDASVVAGVVASSHPALARGLGAARARRAGWFDEWSGRVGADDALVVDADRPRSPTGLERYAECPFRSFLGFVLGVGAIDDPTDAELISALDEGSLVHEVLEDFIREHAGKPPDEPWTDEERDRLDAIAALVTGRYEAEGRTGRPLLWGVRREQLRHQLHRVLEADQRERARQQVSPVDVELAFDDLAVVLANGRTVSFRGIIDRVDRSVDGRRLVVYDYKTGSPSTFTKVKQAIQHDGDLTARGTKLQLPIYALAARAAYPDAEEVASYYWFVGRKGLGDTVGAVVDERAEARFREVVDVVVEGIEQGRFPANPGDESWQFGQWTFEHCGWCEFDRICPTSRGEQWVQLRTAPELSRYRELADPEPEAVDAAPEPEEAAS